MFNSFNEEIISNIQSKPLLIQLVEEGGEHAFLIDPFPSISLDLWCQEEEQQLPLLLMVLSLHCLVSPGDAPEN